MGKNCLLYTSHVAPTAANLQPVHLIAVQSEEGLAKISKAAGIYNAPLAIIVCADPVSYTHLDVYKRQV